ncbi:histidine kinase [Kribbella sp. CA-247076]|uniref:sensor histidine kinase n=1 Tax=Kribbella sp. CA-247076 TaxID=3239941 RepID=UPI003D930280
MTADEWPRGRWAWVAGLGVAALEVLTVLDLTQHYQVAVGAVLALGLARALSLALVWLHPRAALVGSLLVTAIAAAVTVPVAPSEPWPWATTSAFGTSFVLAIAGARGLGRNELLLWWIAIQVLGLVAVASAPERGGWGGLFVMAVLSGVAGVVGELLRSRGETRRRLAQQEGISKEERAERERLQERARIARELHDVVAHHLSVVVVRADSAPHRLARLPDDVQDEFAEIAGAARASLAEMRRVLRLLRDHPSNHPADHLGDHPSSHPANHSSSHPANHPGDHPGGHLDGRSEVGELGPVPGLGELSGLVASTRRAGVDVRLDEEVPTGLDPAVELTAYRVVQEALSNAVRHAPKSDVQVTVRRDRDELLVRVQNGPARSDEPSSPGSGLGLMGMRERVALVDGTVNTGPTPEGGYLVEASIPLGEEVTSADPGAGG